MFVGGIVARHARGARRGAAAGRRATRAAAWLARAAARPAPGERHRRQRGEPARHAFLPPRILPKLDLHEHGIPPEFRTAVVVPTLFGSVEAVREALEHLEVQFLANREPHLHFALLSDFTDSPTETRDGRRRDRRGRGRGRPRAQRALRARDARTPSTCSTGRAAGIRSEGVWMGWERKRGKLAEFNRFVRGGASDAFSIDRGRRRAAPQVRYVITLDSDTVLPPDAAPLLVGAIAHPLNRAVYDPALGRVVRGYGILQPRVGVSLPSAYRSRFAAIHSGPSRRRSVHDGGVRRLPGPLRRGELHRQGHLRRRRVRAGDARPIPREHAALARPDRGQLRARRARDRHRACTTTTRRAT